MGKCFAKLAAIGHVRHPDKIHYVCDDGYYLCKRQIRANVNKSTQDLDKITCKNCQQIFMNYPIGLKYFGDDEL